MAFYKFIMCFNISILKPIDFYMIYFESGFYYLPTAYPLFPNVLTALSAGLFPRITYDFSEINLITPSTLPFN